MDKDIVDLVGDMDDILSFVEDVDVLKDKLKRFTSTIEEILLTIDKCCSWIKKFLETNAAGMSPGILYTDVLTIHHHQVEHGKLSQKQSN